VKYLLVNLAGVRYIDAAGIGELVACHNHVQARQGLIRLIGPSGRVQALLALTRIGEAFKILRTEREALASLSHSSGGKFGTRGQRSAVASP
jgi:anti-sigma B factor antagonist